MNSSGKLKLRSHADTWSVGMVLYELIYYATVWCGMMRRGGWERTMFMIGNVDR